MKRQVVLMLLLTIPCSAKDFGIHGATFTLEEENILHVIQQKLQTLEESGELKKHQQQITEQAQQRLRRPVPVKNLVTTQTPRSWFYDPTITVSQDMKDHKGRLFAAKGTQFNPLSLFSWGAPLLFLNGDDPTHIAWARRQDKYAQWVLTQGSPLDLEQQEHRAIYFDQGGRLSRKFGLHQIPCRISQQGKKLLIEEVLPSEELIVSTSTQKEFSK